jgi:hypothetical protein
MWKSAGRAPSLRVLPWHLSYKWGKSTEKTSVRVRKTSIRIQYTYYQYIYTLQNLHTHTHTHQHITKPTHTHTHIHIHTHPHITKQSKQYKTTTVKIKTNTVQDMPKWNSQNIIKYPQYKYNIIYSLTQPNWRLLLKDVFYINPYPANVEYRVSS